jgi:hypothetical protein
LVGADLDIFRAAFFEFIELAEGNPRHKSAESGGMGRRTRMPVLLVQSKRHGHRSTAAHATHTKSFSSYFMSEIFTAERSLALSSAAARICCVL